VKFGIEGVKSGDAFGLPGAVRPEFDIYVVDVPIVVLVR
jgi:hypothetical protein